MIVKRASGILVARSCAKCGKACASRDCRGRCRTVLGKSCVGKKSLCPGSERNRLTCSTDVKVSIDGQLVTVEGPKGKLAVRVPAGSQGAITTRVPSRLWWPLTMTDRSGRAFHGLTRVADPEYDRRREGRLRETLGNRRRRVHLLRSRATPCRCVSASPTKSIRRFPPGWM